MMPRIISRAAAKRRGLKRYFTGKPCIHGHTHERIVSSRCCLGCQRAYNSSPKGRARMTRYDRAPKGRERRWKTNHSPKGRDSLWRYHQSPKGREAQRRYDQAPKGQDRIWRRVHSEVGKETRRRYQRSAKYQNYRRGYENAERLNRYLDPKSSDFNMDRAYAIIARRQRGGR